MDVAVTTSSIVFTVTPDVISSLLEVLQFFSLLPTHHLPITQPRLLFFGPTSKRDSLLSFEMRSYRQASFSIRSLHLLIPLCDIHIVDQNSSSLVELQIDKIEASPENGLSVESIQFLAGCSKILSIPKWKVQVHRQTPFEPSISDFSKIFEETVVHREALFINAPTTTTCFASFFQKNLHRALFTLTTSLPEISVVLDQKSVVALLRVVQLLPTASTLPSLHFYQPAFYETPLLEIQMSCDSLSLQLQSDIFKQEDTSRFLSISLTGLSFCGYFGGQNTDMTVDFDALLVLVRFIHLAMPMTLETLTGYDGDVEMDSWEAAKYRYMSLPSSEVELLSVESSHLHMSTAMHLLPSLHCWLLSQGEQCRGSTSLCEIGLGTRLRCDCVLGRIDLFWDDVAVADLLWGVLSIFDLVMSVLPQGNESYDSNGMETSPSDMVFQISCPLLSLTCVYNQKPFQELSAPGVFFEFGMLQYVNEREVSPSKFVCGLSTHGIYWTDLTNEFVTNQVDFRYFGHR